MCWQHLNERAKAAADNTSPLDPLPEIDLSSTPDDVINRWLRSRDEKTRFFAAKTALARELARRDVATPTESLSELTDEELEQRVLAVERLWLDRRDNPPPPRARKATKARDVMAELKTSRDYRISVNAALELEAYDEAIGAAVTHQEGPGIALDHLAFETVMARTKELLEILKQPPTPYAIVEPQTDEQLPPPTPEPTPDLETDEPMPEPRRITIERYGDGSWTERIPQPDGSILVREHAAPSKPFNPFSLLNNE